MASSAQRSTRPIVWVNEVQEAAYASRGLSLTQPYLDRALVEFIASIPPRDRPFDGRSKALVRIGFREWLPSSVINRRTQAFADDYLDVQFARLGADLRDRYPTVPEAALRYFDPQHYAGLLRDIEIDPPGFATRETLWAAWTVMLWLDGLEPLPRRTWRKEHPLIPCSRMDRSEPRAVTTASRSSGIWAA